MLSLSYFEENLVGRNQKGFTIIELMVATTTFSVVLLIATTTLIAVGRLYSKNIIQSTTQETARNASEEVTRTFQFSNTDIVPLADVGNQRSFCIGDTKYTYVLNQQVKDGVIGLRSERLSTPSCSGAATRARELLGENMRLLDFQVNPLDANHKIYGIKLRVAYGDNDLLTHYDNNGAPVDPPNLVTNAATATCKSGVAGSNFCAVSELDNVVRKRLE